MNDPAAGLSVLHVIVRAGPTNSQYNEHCLPVRSSRRITVCSLFPAEVVPPPELTLYEGDGSMRGCFRVLRRALDFARYDVVHVHAPASGMVTLATYARLRRSRQDLVYTVHNSWKNFRVRNRLFLRIILAFFPLVVFCGQAAHDSLPRRLRRRHEVKLAVVPNGVDVDRIDRVLDRRNGAGPQPGPGLTQVCANRLIAVKDPLTLVSAFAAARSPEDRLVLVGDGQLRSSVEARVAELDLAKHVTVTGVIPRDEVYRTMATSDLFVSTSAGEGLPVALLEAMACRLPVVVSDIEPHREVARAAGGMPLVPVGDVEGFARALERIEAMSPVARDKVGRRMRQCVLEHFSVKVMNDGYGVLYDDVARLRTPGARSLAAGAHSTRDWDALTLGEKLRRKVGLLTVLGVLGATGGFGVALVQSPVYKGETTVRVGQDLGVAVDEQALRASAAMAVQYADLARREPVLGPVAEAGFAEAWRDLQPDVFSRVGDKNPQLIQVSVYASDREVARSLAAAVADSLVTASRALVSSEQSKFLRGQLAALEQDMRTTTADLQTARNRLEGAGPVRTGKLRTRIAGLQSALAEQRGSYSELDRIDSTDTAALSVVDAAWTTRSPLRPTPVVLALAGAAIGATLAVAWVQLFGRPPRRWRREAQPQVAAPADEAQSPRTNGHPQVSPWPLPEPVLSRHKQPRTKVTRR